MCLCKCALLKVLQHARVYSVLVVNTSNQVIVMVIGKGVGTVFSAARFHSVAMVANYMLNHFLVNKRILKQSYVN